MRGKMQRNIALETTAQEYYSFSVKKSTKPEFPEEKYAFFPLHKKKPWLLGKFSVNIREVLDFFSRLTTYGHLRTGLYGGL